MDGISGGTVECTGEKISDLSENKMAEFRTEKFGFVFQQTHLVSNLTLLENVAVAGYARSKKIGIKNPPLNAPNLFCGR